MNAKKFADIINISESCGYRRYVNQLLANMLASVSRSRDEDVILV